ncbi:hypothetical protein BDN72DRAFT_260751 [Pluteus cervinus]|uniref:Uncharacterized protein n=1 Tax=Pluteus cervinus TaxID=181527 RepID=A0ACD3AF99_9AGAR|nr:hypothetical protein BDN72DRAFT_260751 [Pluteus cervinus]
MELHESFRRTNSVSPRGVDTRYNKSTPRSPRLQFLRRPSRSVTAIFATNARVMATPGNAPSASKSTLPASRMAIQSAATPKLKLLRPPRFSNFSDLIFLTTPSKAIEKAVVKSWNLLFAMVVVVSVVWMTFVAY